jgi:hypothetical protein
MIEHWTVVLGLWGAVLFAEPAEGLAQQPDEPCSYDTCALRLKSSGWFSRGKVVRGVEEVEVAGYGRSSTLEELFAADDSAAVRYATFARLDRRGNRWGIAGLGLFATGAIASALSEGDTPSWALGLQIGGVTFQLIGIHHLNRGREAFQEGIWWYNRSLEPAPR